MAVKKWTGATIAWGTNTQMNALKIIEELAFSASRPEIDYTSFGSTQPTTRQVGGREFGPGALGEFTWTIRVQFDPTVDPAFAASDDVETFTVTPPSAVASNALTFSGFVREIGGAMPLDGLPTLALTIRGSGVMALPSS